jgi:hypothetical protein
MEVFKALILTLVKCPVLLAFLLWPPICFLLPPLAPAPPSSPVFSAAPPPNSLPPTTALLTTTPPGRNSSHVAVSSTTCGRRILPPHPQPIKIVIENIGLIFTSRSWRHKNCFKSLWSLEWVWTKMDLLQQTKHDRMTIAFDVLWQNLEFKEEMLDVIEIFLGKLNSRNRSVCQRYNLTNWQGKMESFSLCSLLSWSFREITKVEGVIRVQSCLKWW